MSVKVQSFVPQAIAGVKKGAAVGILKTAVNVTNQAKGLTPVDTGQLKGSIMYKTGSGESGGHTEGVQLTESASGLSAVVGTSVEHGVYQEYGTRKMAAQPFLRPAVDIVTNGTSGQKAMADAIYDSVQEKLLRISGGFV